MKTEYSDAIVRVIDNGLFVSFARMLGRSGAFKEVQYWSPFSSAFPRSQQVVIGDGFDDIRRVNFPLDDATSVGLWVFLDLYHADLQIYLEEQGCRVWGARKGEEMELYRWDFKQYLKKIGLPVQHVERVVGFDKLRDHLKEVKDKFVKTSFVRGDFETFHHQEYKLSEPRIDELEHTLGAVKRGYEFVVEDCIPNAVEVGYDGFTIDGKFPSHAMMAYEVKDCGMIGVALPYKLLANPVREVNDRLAETLKGYSYRGFFSTEIRYTSDKKPYLIDPCCRLGTPSNELLQELFDNWPEVLWHGAVGEVRDLHVKEKYGVMAVINSEWAVNDWQSVHYPESLDSYVKLRFHTRLGGTDFVAPQIVGLPDLGGVVGTGPSLMSAITQCKQRASQIKGFQVKVSLESIDQALETIKKGEKFGIRFGDEPLPTAEQVRKA